MLRRTFAHKEAKKPPQIPKQGARSDQERWTIPPGLDGVVLRAALSEIRDRHGLVLRWSAVLIVSPRSPRPTQRDGI